MTTPTSRVLVLAGTGKTGSRLTAAVELDLMGRGDFTHSILRPVVTSRPNAPARPSDLRQRVQW
jgi:hypothetical protein